MASATLGVISIGDMGLGISKLLLAHSFKVITNVAGRSAATQARAKDSGIELLSSDEEILNKADFVLSIVPPRDAIATAQRFAKASKSKGHGKAGKPTYYLDLNAISPKTARDINDIFANDENFRFIDGGIIGGPPSLKQDGTWSKPSIPVSGPHRLSEATPSGERLTEVLNINHINSTIGSATGLKMCFASLSKGFTALAIQSFTTAQSLGVVNELRNLLDEYTPGTRTKAERGLVSMQSKAYRWVNEMEEIANTFEADGGFSQNEGTFRAIARIYESVAGEEIGQTGKGKKDADSVANALLEGNIRRKEKTE